MITDTAFLRNRNYHLASDTYDRLDYRRMAEVVRTVHAAVRGVLTDNELHLGRGRSGVLPNGRSKSVSIRDRHCTL